MVNTTPILLEYCLFVIIFILGTTPSICVVSSSVVLASCIARIAIFLCLMILAILGHVELWALSFSPLIFHDASMTPFFFLVLIGIVFCFYFILFYFYFHSCSSMFIPPRSDVSVDESISLQKGIYLSFSDSSCLWLVSVVSDSVEVVIPFSFLISVGLVLLGMIIGLLR